MQRRFIPLLGAAALTVAGTLAFVHPASAQLTLTLAGTTGGFSLSTFADSFPAVGSGTTATGPLGIAFNNGHVVVSDYPGNVRIFPTDTDGQHASSVPAAHNYGQGQAIGLGSVGNSIYMTSQSGNNVSQIDSSGQFVQNIVSNTNATGIIANPANGHLFVSNGSNIFDVDPLNKTSVLFNNAPADGLSTDGTNLYASISSTRVLGYNIATKAQIFDSGVISTVDGTALGFGSLAGNIFANTNDGRFVEINLATSAQTVLATGGSRGDFVTVDPNGTLLITQSNSIVRLTATGGGFAQTPEPGSIALLAGVGISGGLFLKRRRK